MYWSRSLYTEPELTDIEPESSGSCIVLGERYAHAPCSKGWSAAAEPAFGKEALEEMTDFLENIAENWAWSYACGILIAMAARIMSLTDELEVCAVVRPKVNDFV